MQTHFLIRIAAVMAVACLSFAAKRAFAEPDAGVYESETYPIRVFSNDEALGLAAVEEAEIAWEQQIVEMGFPQPQRVVDGEVVEGFDAWMDEDIGTGVLATFDILGDNPNTPASDCPTIGRLNPTYMSEEILTMGIRHLLNHGSLHAVDCIEPQMPAFDMFTDAVEVMNDDDHPYWKSAYLPGFQSMPWKSLDWVATSMPAGYYMFGSALFALFLEEKYGDADGSFLVSAWARTPQDGTILSQNQEWCTADVDNEPDFLDGIAAELEARGATMEEALIAFTEWRYFVGADDDGAHFAKGATWDGGEVVLEAALAISDLPVVNAEQENKLGETGAAFIELDLAGADPAQRLAFSFAGNAATRWAAQLLLVPAEGPAVVQTIPLDSDTAGTSGDVDVSAYAKVVLAVTDLGDGVHDPEDAEWTSLYGSFRYSIEPHAAEDGEPDAGADAGADTGADAGEIAADDSEDGCSCRIVASPADAGLLATLL